jgi:hypothetical protein
VAYLLIKAVDAVNTDPDVDRRGCYKRGMIVEVREDGSPLGTSETLPLFVRINVPMITAERVRKYMEPEYSGIPLEVPEVYRRRRWQIRWADLPAAARNKLQTQGFLTIKATADYTGVYDYTWQQVRGYFRDLKTGLDETVDL